MDFNNLKKNIKKTWNSFLEEFKIFIFIFFIIVILFFWPVIMFLLAYILTVFNK